MTGPLDAELLDHLREQMTFLADSAAAFDEGKEPEAKRLAVTLRLLLHHTRKSKSLLTQLGAQDVMSFVDTSRIPKPDPYGTVVSVWDAGLAVVSLTGSGVTYEVPLGDAEDHDGDAQAVDTDEANHYQQRTWGPQEFEAWWNRVVLHDTHGEGFTRRDLVLFMANQAGGAHVDVDIQPRLDALTKMNSLGWSTGISPEGHNFVAVGEGDGDPLGNPIPANIRQIAYEVDRSIKRFLLDQS